MPCACLIPVPSYPENAEWGPILWNILHGLAERAGQGIIKTDEVREWQKFIKLTGEMLPCDVCRAHYQEYMKAHPPSQLTIQTNDWVKKWYWTLHNEINTSKNLPEYPYDDLNAQYSSVNLTDLLYRLNPVIKKAIELNGVQYIKWTAWVSSYKMLRSILAV